MRLRGAPFSRTFRPSSGSAMPRLPQNLPPSIHGDSQPRPSTAWYSMSAGLTPSRGARLKPSIHRRLPRVPIHSPTLPGTSPVRWTWATTSASSALTPGGAACPAGAAAGAWAALPFSAPSRITCSRGALFGDAVGA